MTIKVAINGFGRIGRNILRAYLERMADLKEIEFVAINDLAPPATNAHLLKYDSTHGTIHNTVEAIDGALVIDGIMKIKLLAERDPAALPWRELGVDVVLECTGLFTSKEKSNAHLKAGAKRVIISAPGGEDVDATIVYGVNHKILTPEMTIISNASCTTNCLAPVAFLLDREIGIDVGYMTTVHSYTNDQSLLDVAHKDLQRARAAALSMIPTSTGAAKALGLVLPNLKGKLDGMSLRVPTPNVSVVDFKCTTKRNTTVEEIKSIMMKASQGELAGVLGYNTEPLVSIDYKHNPLSCIFDAPQTVVLNEHFVRIMAWYDNEWGFSNRMLDTLKIFGRKLG